MATTRLIISLIALILSALFSGSEIAFVTSDRVKTELDVKRGGLISKILARFYSNSEFFISSILVGNNVVLVIYGMGTAYLLEPVIAKWTDSEALILIIQTLISTAVILITAEFLPKTVFRINPNNSLKIVAIPIYFFYILFWPISMFATWLSRGLMKLLGFKSHEGGLSMLSVTDLNDYLEETITDMQEDQSAVENEVKIFQNALDFSTCHLRDCMTPRNEMVAVDYDETSREQLSALFTESGRSKIIVYKDDIDNIVGYIHVRELFEPGGDWRDSIKPVLFAPENLLADKMMRRMLQGKKSLAIVVDEFGGTAGLITLEDLVEEIFGDIQDEHDKTRQMCREIEPGIYECSARCEIEELNDLYHFDIPEDDDYQTLSGYILCSTGSIPEQGESVLLGNLRFDILKKIASRLELIRITVIAEEKPEEE